MAKKAAKGGGTIRQRPDGRWEARFTLGRDPGTGKQVQRSVYGSTQKEVRQKLAQITAAIDKGIYSEPCKMTVGQWLDIWQRDYLGGVKPATVTVYTGNIKNHIKPALGAVRLNQLHPHTVQGFVNGLELSPASVRLAFKVLHMALEKAVELDYIPRNPAARCQLPRMEQKEIHPLDDQQVSALLAAAKGGKLEHLVTMALFTGLRLSELLGLTWDAVDLQRGTINVNKQLALSKHRGNGLFVSPKAARAVLSPLHRTITTAPTAIRTLKAQKRRQAEMQLRAGPLWNNPYSLVFTDELGGPLLQQGVDAAFRTVVSAAGLGGVRFHDTRHPYVKHKTKTFSKFLGFSGSRGMLLFGLLQHFYNHLIKRITETEIDFSTVHCMDTYTDITEQMPIF